MIVKHIHWGICCLIVWYIKIYDAAIVCCVWWRIYFETKSHPWKYYHKYSRYYYCKHLVDVPVNIFFLDCFFFVDSFYVDNWAGRLSRHHWIDARMCCLGRKLVKMIEYIRTSWKPKGNRILICAIVYQTNSSQSGVY